MTLRPLQVAAFVAASCAALTPSVYAQQRPEPVVRTHLDRTAMWIADRVTYAVEIVCPKGIDILADDLAREKLKTTGLDIVSTDTSTTTAADDAITYRIRYVLTTYRADTPTLAVAPLSVRYFVRRPGARLEDTAPAGEFQVPGAAIAFRSTLPNNPETATLRDVRSPSPRRQLFTNARAVGFALVLVSFAPLAFVAVSAARHWRPRRAAGSARRHRREAQLTYDALASADLSTIEGRRRAYDGIDALVRAHLRDVVGVAGPSLTPAEISGAAADRRMRVAPETVAALLASCEQARYGPPEIVPSAETCREAVAQAGQILGARSA